MAELKLVSGETAIVDDDDYERLSAFRWYMQRSGTGTPYVVRKEVGRFSNKAIYLQREVAGAENDRLRFVNGNPLDCRKENLQATGKIRTGSSLDKGAFAEAMVAADFLRNGFDVFMPFSGHAAADMVASFDNGIPLRWQVKYRRATGSAITLSLRNVHSNAKGTQLKPIDLGKIDGFAIYCPDTDAVYYLAASALRSDQTTVSIRIDQPRGKQGSRSRLGEAMTCPVEFFRTFCRTPSTKTEAAS